jgi:hypothetical protein
MKTRLPFLLLILVCAVPTMGQSNNADFWYDLAGLGGDFFTDPNTGQTGFAILDLPLGGKFESMGRAYTAMTGDWGFFYSNPAGSSFMDHTEVVLLHSDWIADSNVEGVLYGTSTEDFGVGLAGKVLYVPFQEKGPWGEDEAQVYYSEGAAVLNGSYRLLERYNESTISAGANLKFAYRNMPAIIYPGQFFAALLLDSGVTARLNVPALKFFPYRGQNLGFGLAVKNLGLPPNNDEANDDYGEALPTEASAGLTYSPIQPLIVSVDFNLPFFLYRYYDIDPDGEVVQLSSESWNMAGGFDLSVTPFFNLQGGFGWDGGNPRFSIGTTIDLQDISLQVNYTLDLATRVDQVDRFSLNASFDLGDWGRAERQQRAEDLYAEGLQAYSIGELDRAISLWESVKEINGRFTPAIDALEIAREQKRLQEEIRDLGEIKIGDDESAPAEIAPGPDSEENP